MRDCHMQSGETRKILNLHLIVRVENAGSQLTCYRSPHYRAIIGLRRHVAVSDIVVIEGYAG